MGKKVLFFIGSGCSFLTGQPSVAGLSEDVLNGEMYIMDRLDPEGCFLDGLSDYYPRWGPKADFGDQASMDIAAWRRPAESIQCLLREVAKWEWWTRNPNYEDLSGILRIIAGTLHQGTNDPSVECLLCTTEFLNAVQSLDFPQGHRFHDYSLNQKVSVVEDFIGWTVARRILIDPTLDGYDSFMHAVGWLSCGGHDVHLATTNYDCNLEKLLTAHEITYDDGFVGDQGEDSDGRIWRLGNEFRFFETKSTPLLKLHGSSNWFSCFDEHGSGSSALAICDPTLPPELGFMSRITSSSQHLFTPKQSPEVMRGALSKAFEYSYGVYSMLLANLERMLSHADLLVVAGFGWSDEALVARFIRFAHTNGKSLLALDGSQPDSAVSKVREVDRRMLGQVGEGKPISVHRAHMSSIAGEDLVSVMRSCWEG